MTSNSLLLLFTLAYTIQVEAYDILHEQLPQHNFTLHNLLNSTSYDSQKQYFGFPTQANHTTPQIDISYFDQLIMGDKYAQHCFCYFLHSISNGQHNKKETASSQDTQCGIEIAGYDGSCYPLKLSQSNFFEDNKCMQRISYQEKCTKNEILKVGSYSNNGNEYTCICISQCTNSNTTLSSGMAPKFKYGLDSLQSAKGDRASSNEIVDSKLKSDKSSNNTDAFSFEALNGSFLLKLAILLVSLIL